MAQSTPQSKKTTVRKPVVTKKATTKTSTTQLNKMQPVNNEERYQMITEAAYLIAEQRGFQGNHEMDDWLQAEAEVDARFSARH